VLAQRRVKRTLKLLTITEILKLVRRARGV
jgi:hypothetical protein